MAAQDNYSALRINLFVNADSPRNIALRDDCDAIILRIETMDADITAMNAPILAATGRDCYLLEKARVSARRELAGLRDQCIALQNRYSNDCFALQGAG